MIDRRRFIQLSSAALGSRALSPLAAIAQNLANDSPDGRPARAARQYISPAVEKIIGDVQASLGDRKLSRLFANCFPNTLDTTVRAGTISGKPDTFVITGDINAMWLRDSSAQVWPYVPLAKEDAAIETLLAGVILRQARCILIDPYANAFNYDREGGEFEHDLTAMKPELHERKWEIDSLCYPVRLAHGYWKTTGHTGFFASEWHAAAKLIVQTFREQQRKHGPGPYSFRRNTISPNDTLNLDGYGNPVRAVGLIASGFRPSDDACLYPFHIPSNFFACRSLEQLAEIAHEVWKDAPLADDCRQLAKEVGDAIQKFGIVEHPQFGRIYAYEVDGFGNQLMMDDANVPSLLALPYLGSVPREDEVCRNTRKFVLSEANPYFFKGSAAEGIGGPHVGLEMIWPISIIMRGLTSTDASEISSCLKTLLATDAGTGFMHESFHRNNPQQFTRRWFAWANTLFGEFVLKLWHERPDVLKEMS